MICTDPDRKDEFFKYKKSFLVSEHWMHCCAYNNDSTRIAVGNSEGDIFILNPKTGALKFKFQGNGTQINSISFNHDGTKLVSGCKSGHIVIWSSDGGALRIQVSTRPVTCVCFNNDGTEIISGAMDGMIRIWNSATGASKHILRGHNLAVQNLSYQYGPRGHEIVSLDYDNLYGWIKNDQNSWDMTLIEKIAYGNLYHGGACKLYKDILVYGKNHLSYRTRNTIGPWKEKKTFKVDGIKAIDISKDGTLIAIVYSKTVQLYNVTNKTLYRDRKLLSESDGTGVSFGHDNKHLLVSCIHGINSFNLEWAMAVKKYRQLLGLRDLYKKFPLHPDDPNNYQYKFQLDSVNISMGKVTIKAFIRHKYLTKHGISLDNAGDVFKIETIHGHWKVSKIKRDGGIEGKDTYNFYIHLEGQLLAIIRNIILGEIIVDDKNHIMYKF